jgi:diguanylate cyclase (GGDEF)-like protein/PAS domain S-box-containing protein
MWDTISAGEVWRGNMVNRRKDGSHYHEEMTITPVLDESGKVVNYLAIKEDVTAIIHATEKLAASEERFRQLINSVHAHFYWSEYIPEKGFVNRYISDNFESLTGYPSSQFKSDWGFWATIVHPEDKPILKETIKRIHRGESTESEYRIIRPDGKEVWISDNAQVNVSNDEINVYATMIDITERKEIQDQIRFLATHDPLTKLPNRILFEEILEHSLLIAKRNDKKVGIFFLDVDEFKAVNDTYGHHIGDDLLKSIAGRITNSLRETDTACRISGDEFTIITEQLTSTEDAEKIARKLGKSLSGKYQLREHQLDICVSVGGSIFPDHGQDFETLLQRADAAMYLAKNSPGLRYKIYETE